MTFNERHERLSEMMNGAPAAFFEFAMLALRRHRKVADAKGLVIECVGVWRVRANPHEEMVEDVPGHAVFAEKDGDLVGVFNTSFSLFDTKELEQEFLMTLMDDRKAQKQEEDH